MVYKFVDDQGSYLAALITYYGFLSLFPLLLLLVTILGFVLHGDPHLQAQAAELGAGPVPGDRQPAARERARASRAAALALAVGIVGTLYGCLGAAQAHPERAQPGVGGAAQRTPEPDQVTPAQPAAGGRARPRRARHDWVCLA